MAFLKEGIGFVVCLFFLIYYLIVWGVGRGK